MVVGLLNGFVDPAVYTGGYGLTLKPVCTPDQPNPWSPRLPPLNIVQVRQSSGRGFFRTSALRRLLELW